MTSVIKKAIIAVLLSAMLLCFAGCSQADRVSSNISKEADSFNVVRHLVAINMRTDTIMFEVTGTFALKNNAAGELAIVAQTGPEEYRKHYIYINDQWTSYTVEDISGSDVDPFKFEINFFPEMLIPVKVTQDY